jgi:hypothetical protein
MIRIEAPYFVAGVDGERVAPIIKYMKGWSADKIVEYCNKKNWKYIIINELPENPLFDN